MQSCRLYSDWKYWKGSPRQNQNVWRKRMAALPLRQQQLRSLLHFRALPQRYRAWRHLPLPLLQQKIRLFLYRIHTKERFGVLFLWVLHRFFSLLTLSILSVTNRNYLSTLLRGESMKKHLAQLLCCWIPFRRPRKKAIASLKELDWSKIRANYLKYNHFYQIHLY